MAELRGRETNLERLRLAAFRRTLAGMFSTVVFSQDHGFEKPATELFDIAAAAVRCPPDQVAMVGDSLINDVAGARRAGWFGIWLNRENAPCPAHHAPHAQITSLVALPDALTQLAAAPPDD